jgi:hypothetical protein
MVNTEKADATLNGTGCFLSHWATPFEGLFPLFVESFAGSGWIQIRYSDHTFKRLSGGGEFLQIFRRSIFELEKRVIEH